MREWVAALVDQRDALIERLAIGPEEGWPAPRAVAPEPFDDEDEVDGEVAENTRQPAPWNEERPVFRVRDVRYGAWGSAGGLFGGVLAIALLATGTVEGPVWFILALSLGVAAGAALAPGRAQDQCSDPSCGGPLRSEDARCPRCGGLVAGRIRNGSQRLEAEEALGVAWYRERGLPVPSSLEDDELGGEHEHR